MKRLPPFDWRHTPYNDGVQRFIRGLLEFVDDGKYEGEWIQNEGKDIVDGRGVFMWSNGKRYDGYFKNG